MSPKLSTSVDWDCKFLTEQQRDHHNSTRINYKNLYDIIRYSKNYQFKFVYSGPECINEIKDIYSKIASFVDKVDESSLSSPTISEIDENHRKLFIQNISYSTNESTLYSFFSTYVYLKLSQLMPEGTTNDLLNDIQVECVNACIENGWRFADRLHIRIWGDKRGV